MAPRLRVRWVGKGLWQLNDPDRIDVQPVFAGWSPIGALTGVAVWLAARVHHPARSG